MVKRMEEILLATDVVLEVIIGSSTDRANRLIDRARKGEIQINILQSALYWAFYSVKKDDKINFRQVAELFKYAQIVLEAPIYLGPQDREGWTPSQQEVDNWRKCATEK
jgi:hypothetical protein